MEIAFLMFRATMLYRRKQKNPSQLGTKET